MTRLERGAKLFAEKDKWLLTKGSSVTEDIPDFINVNTAAVGMDIKGD